MKIEFGGAQRQFRNFACSLALIGLSTGIIAMPGTVEAQTRSQSLIVQNDRGGLLNERIREIERLRRSRTPIEIRGGICYSTCTLYLGLPNTCISPNTTFGFHGPSSYGRALEPALFRRASEIISSHYPAPLKRWYMSEARYQINSVARVKGASIIEMGVRAC